MNESTTIEILSYGKVYHVTTKYSPSNAALYFVSSTDFNTLCLHRALAHSGLKFWTSIPEGRQSEAEHFGPLIEKFMKREQLQQAPGKAQYPINIDDINSGKVCPYCGKLSELTDSAEIYGQSYGNIYLCRPCQAWVGVHKSTNQALGRLGTKELRALHREAHEWLDKMHQEGIIRQLIPMYIQGVSDREKTYLWLAEQMGIQREYCHIGFFDEQQSRQVIDICRPVMEQFNPS